MFASMGKYNTPLGPQNVSHAAKDTITVACVEEIRDMKPENQKDLFANIIETIKNNPDNNAILTPQIMYFRFKLDFYIDLKCENREKKNERRRKKKDSTKRKKQENRKMTYERLLKAINECNLDDFKVEIRNHAPFDLSNFEKNDIPPEYPCSALYRILELYNQNSNSVYLTMIEILLENGCDLLYHDLSDNDIFHYITDYKCLPILETILNIMTSTRKKKKSLSYLFTSQKCPFLYTCKKGWSDGFYLYLKTGYFNKMTNDKEATKTIKVMQSFGHQCNGIEKDNVYQFIQIIKQHFNSTGNSNKMNNNSSTRSTSLSQVSSNVSEADFDENSTNNDDEEEDDDDEDDDGDDGDERIDNKKKNKKRKDKNKNRNDDGDDDDNSSESSNVIDEISVPSNENDDDDDDGYNDNFYYNEYDEYDEDNNINSNYYYNVPRITRREREEERNEFISSKIKKQQQQQQLQQSQPTITKRIIPSKNKSNSNNTNNNSNPNNNENDGNNNSNINENNNNNKYENELNELKKNEEVLNKEIEILNEYNSNCIHCSLEYKNEMMLNWNINNNNSENEINPFKSLIYLNSLSNNNNNSSSNSNSNNLNQVKSLMEALTSDSTPIELDSVMNNQSASAIGRKSVQCSNSLNGCYPPNM